MRKGVVAALAAGVLTVVQGCGEGDNTAISPQAPTEPSIVAAVGASVVSKDTEDDAGCQVTRYKFSDDVFGMTLEFKCNRTNVAWYRSTDVGVAERSRAGGEQARRVVSALTGGDGKQVGQAIQGEVFKGTPMPFGLSLNGSCQMDHCLLSFAGELPKSTGSAND